MTKTKIQSLQEELEKLQKQYKELEEKQLEKLRKGENLTNKGDPKMYSLNNGDGALFFITSYGFKRLYRKPDSDPSFNLAHPTCKPYLNNLEKIGVQQSSGISGELTIPINSGEPCGYENYTVGVKGDSGGYSKLGYISKKGKLHEFASKTLEKAGRTCPTKIVEITNEEWNSFTKSDVGIKDGQECRLFNNSDYDKLIKLEIKIESKQKELKNELSKHAEISEDAEQCLGGQMKKMKKLNHKMNRERRDMESTKAMKEQYDVYQVFYKNRIWILLLLIVLLLGCLILFMKRGNSSTMVPNVSNPSVTAPVSNVALPNTMSPFTNVSQPPTKTVKPSPGVL